VSFRSFTFGDDLTSPPLVDAAPPPLPQGYLWPDGYMHADPPPQQVPYYQQPSFWVNVFANATQRALAPQPVLVPVDQGPPLWLVVGGAVAAVLVIRAVR
jgi:hypothetical protein